MWTNVAHKWNKPAPVFFSNCHFCSISSIVATHARRQSFHQSIVTIANGRPVLSLTMAILLLLCFSTRYSNKILSYCFWMNSCSFRKSCFGGKYMWCSSSSARVKEQHHEMIPSGRMQCGSNIANWPMVKRRIAKCVFRFRERTVTTSFC